MVIQGGSFKGYGKQGDQLKPKEVVSLLLDDDEIERKYKAKADKAAPDSADAAIGNDDSSDAAGAVSSSENLDSGSQSSSRDRELGFSTLSFLAYLYNFDFTRLVTISIRYPFNSLHIQSEITFRLAIECLQKPGLALHHRYWIS